MLDTSTGGERSCAAAITDLRERLQRAGWRPDETRHGSLWQVDACKGKNRIVVTGLTQALAWGNACLLAGVGALAAPRPV
jgi:hypothetical protein